MTLPVEIDHAELGAERLLHQWKDSPKVQGLFKSFLEQSDLLEDIFLQILDDRGIHQAVGIQLDVIGELFGVQREGRVDTQYRPAILQKISVIETDGTTEVFMQVLRTVGSTDFVDFFEHHSGDVHARMGAGFSFNTFVDLKPLVPAGVNLRIYIDDEFDSFVASEVTSSVFLLEIDTLDTIEVDNGAEVFDLEVQTDTVSGTSGALGILPEILDIDKSPFGAELLDRAVTRTSGEFVDEVGNFIVDEEGNNIVWVEYSF